jgi:hypothetical protein
MEGQPCQWSINLNMLRAVGKGTVRGGSLDLPPLGRALQIEPIRDLSMRRRTVRKIDKREGLFCDLQDTLPGW